MRFLPSKSNRKVFGKIAEEYDLVYFGTVDPRVDSDYKAVKGLTLSPQIRDENYTTGNVYDYEIAFLQRSRQVVNAENQKLDRKWTILQIQLKQVSLPPALIDSRASVGGYGALLAATQRWQEIGWQHFTEAEFSKSFAVYARPESITYIASLLTPAVQAMLASHFNQFDYEMLDDKLIIYSTNTEVNLQTLDHMLRVGLWLARYFDQPYQSQIAQQ